ncbi:MAG: metal ABC transporter substrate-binding protein [Lachnospiraceae bacterium]|nr:metal ABC transporter substrate-binding protein [Lachnospiraceae bacterium]
MMKKRLLSVLLTVATTLAVLTGCGSTQSSEAPAAEATAEKEGATEEVSAEDAAAEDSASEEADASSQNGETVVLKGIADLVPHSEIIEFVKPKLAEQGIEIELVSTAADSTTNEKLNAGEIDFNYFQHDPYLQSEIEANGYDLVNAGGIHVEPITAYSDKYESKDEIPENAVVAIPNDATNEYRALRILELNGFITLADSAKDSLSASVSDITEYLIPLEIVELDSAQIIPTKDDYDFFITNTNKALEAKITSAKLFSEGADSPYANIIAVRSEDKDNPAIKALVDVLLSEETQAFIEEKYDGAVIPVK